MISMRSRSEMYRSAATSSRLACGVWLERVGGQRRVARYSRVGKIACAPCPRTDDMAGDFAHPTPTGLQKSRRPHQRAPHVRRRRVVEAEALFRLLEITADDVDEIVEVDLGIGIERVDVV